MLRKILAIVAVLLVIGAAVGYYMWNKPHRTAEDEKPAATLTADELFNQFNSDAAGSNAKYLDKVIQVSGVVNSVKTTENNETKIALQTPDEMGIAEISVILKAGEKADQIKDGTTVVLKGICSGFNTDVELRQAVIIK
jgi:hypothetical protein